MTPAKVDNLFFIAEKSMLYCVGKLTKYMDISPICFGS